MPLLPDIAIAAPLAAGWVEAAWLDGLGPLLVVAFWIIRQVMVAISEQKEGEAQRRAGPNDDRVDGIDQEPALAGQPKAAPAEKQVRSEVEEFLKRIGEPPRDGPQADRADAEPIDRPARRQPIDPFEEPRRRPREARQPAPPVETGIELLIDPDPKPTPVPAVQRPARKELRHLPESQLAENAAQMGERIAGTDDRLESRLHDKFDHRLGKLSQRSSGDTPAEEPTPSETGAARIKALLSRPGGVREAVVLSEILRRPVE